MKLIIVDLDGTLTEVSDQAQHCMGESHTKDQIIRIMDPVKIARLKPRKEIVKTIQDLHAEGSKIVIVTGRWNLLEDLTQAWLRFYKVPFDLMAMRPHSKWQVPSVEVKLSAFNDVCNTFQQVSSFVSSFSKKAEKATFDITWYDDDQNMLDALPSSVQKVKV